MTDTTHLLLPLMAAAQAQKHVTHNEALLRLDALVQMSVKDRDLTAPPAGPTDGDRYIPGSGATGAWETWDHSVAWLVDGVWTKLAPREGWRVWVDDEDALLVWDGAAWVKIEGAAGGGGGDGRELLTADRTYFVDGAGGDDGNDGLSSGAAFATIQKAIDTAASLDLGIFDVTVEIAAGTYADPVALKRLVGAGKVILKGDEATPANVAISTTGASAVSGLYAQGVYSLRGLKLTTATLGSCIALEGKETSVEIQSLDFGAAANNHIHLQFGATITATGDYAVTGGAGRHWLCETQSTLTIFGRTITLTGTPAFTRFVDANTLVSVRAHGNTFSGSATGQRFNVVQNAVINTNNGGASYFPGNTAGATANGGQYV